MTKLLSAFLLFSFSAFSASWYVSPGASGAGTLGSPGSLATAMAHTGWAASIAASDTVYLRAGLYENGTNIMYMQFSGSAGNLVTWRNYPNERAIINHPIYFQTADYHRFRRLEFMDTNKQMRPTAIGYFDSTTGTNYEWINCIIHDTTGVWTGGSGGALISGCIIWNIGKHYSDHVVYPYTLDFSGNIVGWCAGNVIEQGTTATVVRSNIVWGTGLTTSGASDTFLLVQDNHQFYGNRVFETALNLFSIRFNGGGNGIITNNIVAASRPLNISGIFSTGVVRGNTFLINDFIHRLYNAGTWTWDNNAYYSPATVMFYDTEVERTFAGWKTANPTYDAASTAANSSVPPDSVTVIPNADEPKRAHVAVFNWSGASTVSVNLSTVLAVNDIYFLYSAQDYLRGQIASGTFTGTTISVPMTGLTVAPILYATGLTQPTATSPNFAAFVVVGATPTMNVTTMNVGSVP